MNPALKDMLEAYRSETPADYQNAAREIVQEIALLGLWRGGFFEHAAFYGGTALRIFHGLRRFSEDLDFTLVDPGDETRLDRYLPGVAIELESWGFSFEAEAKSTGEASGIESAFLKGRTQLNLLHIGAPADLARRLPQNQRLRIKLEMDLEPPPNATTEVQTQLLPTPYQVRLYDLPSLFAASLGALDGTFAGLAVEGRQAAGSPLYVGPRTALASTVVNAGVCRIGTGAQLHDGVELAGHVDIGDRCVIDDGAELFDSVVMSGTYVGRGVRLQSAIACGSWLYRADLNTCQRVDDPLLLAAGPSADAAA